MKKLIDYLASELEIKDKTLLEKDIILHKLLCELTSDNYFKNNLVFKGGTCLTKCYYGYFRFSEDLDFTWIKQKELENKSQKELRRILSKKINKMISLLECIAGKLNLDFKADKSDDRYVELGGSNKFSTFKLWYKSEVLGVEQFIKIQINFLELFLYKFKMRAAVSLVKGVKELDFLFPEHSKALVANPKILCYDIKEILTEKFRAILTRKGVKARDFIDIFIITNKERIKPRKLKREIIKKTEFMLRYDKYVQNLKNFKMRKFVLGEEEKLMLMPLERGFEEFLSLTHVFLNELTDELKS